MLAMTNRKAPAEILSGLFAVLRDVVNLAKFGLSFPPDVSSFSAMGLASPAGPHSSRDLEQHVRNGIRWIRWRFDDALTKLASDHDRGIELLFFFSRLRHKGPQGVHGAPDISLLLVGKSSVAPAWGVMARFH
jgi:hypothetical protein